LFFTGVVYEGQPVCSEWWRTFCEDGVEEFFLQLSVTEPRWQSSTVMESTELELFCVSVLFDVTVLFSVKSRLAAEFWAKAGF